MHYLNMQMDRQGVEWPLLRQQHRGSLRRCQDTTTFSNSLHRLRPGASHYLSSHRYTDASVCGLQAKNGLGSDICLGAKRLRS